MAKNLMVNCAVCDARKVQEGTLAAYDEIRIHAAVLATNAASRAMLNQYDAELNCASILDMDDDVKLSVVNGKASITSTDAPADRQYLIVNGSLEIGPDSQKALSQYVGILVNGTATYPKSLSSAIPGLTVNGNTACYPDEAIVLKRTAVIDRNFALRAKKSLYWSQKRMIFVDPALDPTALADKGASFSAPEFLIAASKAEALTPLLDDQADVQIVPDGTAVVLDDADLNRTLLRRYGTRLCIVGDLSIPEDAAPLLEQLEYLKVLGDVKLPSELEELFFSKAPEISGDVESKDSSLQKAFSGKCLSDKMHVHISSRLLQDNSDGVCVTDCAKVRLDEDVTPELIRSRLTIRDCAKVVCCTSDQEMALQDVCEDVARIASGNGDADSASDYTTVNAASYIL